MNIKSDLKSKTFFWMSLFWFLLLIIPLVKNTIYLPDSNGHPWRVEFAASLILCSALIFIRKNVESFPVNPSILAAFLLFIAWSGISAFWADSTLSVAHHTFIWFGYLVFYFLFLHFLNIQSKGKNLIGGLGIVLILISLLCLIDFVLIEDFTIAEGVFRIRYAKYGELILIVAPIFWALALQIRNRRALFLLQATGVILWLAVAFSLSRGAFLAGICAFIIFFAGTFLFTRKIYDRRKTVVLAAVWLIVTFASQISFNSKPSTTEYLSGAADQTRETSLFRIFTWQIGWQMIKENSLVGVGADNFGIAFNESRAEFNRLNPDDKLAGMAENYLVERAHNEIIQITAELGIIGLAFFLGLIAAFIIYFARAFIINGFRFTPLLWACLAGMSGFFISSMVSSFSFRAIQNGIVFFFVLALATYETQKIYRKNNVSAKTVFLPRKPVVVFAFGAAAIFFGVSLSVNLSNFYLYRVDSIKELADAEPELGKALTFNPFNSSANNTYALRLYYERQPERAVPFFTKAIENGLDTSIVYYDLAGAYAAAGDSTNAALTLEKAIKIYPRAVFLRVRYALTLKNLGQIELSNQQLETAFNLDEKQARGWLEVMTTGTRAAALKSRAEKSFPEPRDLLPENAIYAVIGEHYVQNLFSDDIARNK